MLGMRNFFITLFASILGVAVSLLVVFGIAMGSLAIFGKGDISSLKVSENSLLEINMNEIITDAPVIERFSDIIVNGGVSSPTISLLNTLMAIERAQSDPNIVAISLRMDGMGGVSLANADELRKALAEFSAASAKPIYAYAESYSQLRYYFASVADKIFIHPLGSVEWKGVGMSSLFYGDLVKKLELKPEIFRPKSNLYKSAVEPYYLNKMSPESRTQNLQIVNDLWSGILSEVAEVRDVTEDQLVKIAAEEFILDAEQSQAAGLVDYISYYDEYVEALGNIGVEVEKGKPNRISLSKYSQLVEYERISESGKGSGNTISIVYIDGSIVDGASEYGGVSGVVGSATIAAQLRSLRENEDVKGVVVRVNSPGGSAMAADVIWREMMLLQEVKPLVVSMGSYAASGGYYVSAPADIIVVNDFTITGSIGVFGVLVDAQQTLKNKLYITMDLVGSTPNATFGSLPQGVTNIQRAAIMRGVDNVYSSFVGKVASGRNMSVSDVEKISGGRVWSGSSAERLGLADKIGGLKYAIMLAVTRSGLEDKKFRLEEMVEQPDELSQILSMLLSRTPSFANSFISSYIAPIFAKEVNLVERDLQTILSSQDGLVMMSPFVVEF